MLDLEASRSSIGCGDASCLAEIAGAMGASLVVFGDVGLLGSTYTITLNLFDSGAATALGRESVQTDRPASLGASLGPALRRLVEPDAARRGLVLASPSPPSGDSVGLPVVIGGAASVVCAAAVVGVGVGHLPWLQFSGAADVARTTTSQAEYDAA